ncbi:LysR family transcriptional regulator [Acetobacter sp.]|jgi:DNA-binding transcriptional LysR family regulator|uniref:LysR family transcriptional regulator n=1 Tax=Acetobacter sp. TaxID=440 RepID=UPI0025C5F591|nr:LysR family transcriptional regulator [Acetobacter sp.]MCH4092352.1 LysR family transcriptional regulator [Acetobacter sp.]MCI1300972.1 LysR family transcriptional regulator [Acetobacter sp.]MCI1317256.1 LysR family transcriptional regulator [Acetobacter sp.]
MSLQKKFRGKITGSDVRLIKVFCTIVECGGFAAAEPVLQIGLPAISRCVSDLEIRTGVTVCRRGKAGFSVTEHGLRLYDYCKRLLYDIERFEHEISSLNTEVSGTLRLAVVDALITDESFRLTAVLNNFCTLYPDVLLNLTSKTTEEVESGIVNNEFDVGIIFKRRAVEKIEYKFLHGEVNHLYCSVGHELFKNPPKNISEIKHKKYSFCGYDLNRATRLPEIVRSFKQKAIVQNMELAATLIGSGCYLGFLPAHYVDSLWRKDDYKKILPSEIQFINSIEIITLKGKTSSLIKKFLFCMHE